MLWLQRHSFHDLGQICPCSRYSGLRFSTFTHFYCSRELQPTYSGFILTRSITTTIIKRRYECEIKRVCIYYLNIDILCYRNKIFSRSHIFYFNVQLELRDTTEAEACKENGRIRWEANQRTREYIWQR